MDTNSHESICVSSEQLLELVREAIQKEVSDLRPLLREELLKSLQLADEAGAIEIFKIGGKDPQRTFRRLANKHKLEYVRIDGFKWWKLSAIEKLIETYTLNRVKKEHAAGRESRIENRESGPQLRAVA
jgi:hypothetical protein